MAAHNLNNSGKKIVVTPDGPYCIEGDIPLVRKSQVVTEYGEPIAWKMEGDIAAASDPALCRCGHSHEKPFCDGTHCEIGFDGTESAPTGPTCERRQTLPASAGLVVSYDPSLCMESGFCANRLTSIDEMADQTADPNIRAQVIAMIERCPSGAYTYALAEGEADVEADLPQQVAVTTEMTSEGPVMGPLWVTGGILVERSDGETFETRNRVALCRCGLSSLKPLCDGAHRAHHVTESE
jgi:CDGSH-type Zn-finger protein